MPSHFSTVGIPIVDSQAAYEEWAWRTFEEGDRVPLRRGEYRVLRSDAGPQLWAAVDRVRRLVAFTPHYVGRSRCRARLTARVRRAGESRFEGGFEGWSLDGWPATSDDAGEDVAPLVFDAPDPLLHAGLRLPALVETQLAAFAHESQWYPDAASFRAGQAGAPVTLAENAFVYLDVFEDDTERSAMAVLAGEVLDTAVRVNELTGHGFRWAAVRTLVGEIDVVADPDVVIGEPSTPGNLLGSFWISGRITGVRAQADAGPRRRWRRLTP